MARLIGPDMAYRLAVLPSGAPAVERPAVLYSDAAGTIPAIINAVQPDNPGVPGASIPGAAFDLDAFGLIPVVWYPDGVTRLYIRVNGGPAVPVDADYSARLGQVLALTGGSLAGSLGLASSFAGGEDDGQPGQFDSTSRLNLYSYQRADVGSYGETIRHYAMRKDSKQMEAWYFPAGGYDANREPVGTMKPVVWAGAHWEANNHASNHKHWSVETPDSTGAIQTRFEVRFGDPNVDNAIAGLDKTLVMTNLADFVVRCTNGQELRLSAPVGQEKSLTFSHDYAGADQYRRWKIRATNETESGGNAGSNWQLARYDDAGTFLDNPIVVSRSTGNVTLGPGLVARRSSSTVSTLSLNTSSLGGGVGVLAVGEAFTPPAANPTAGVVLYVQGGRLKVRQPDGTNQFVALTAV